MPKSETPTPVGNRLSRSVVWNYIGYFYQIAINLAVTGYVARHIAVPEYGLLLFVMSLSSVLFLLDFGISSVLIQAYVEAASRKDLERRNDLISSSFWVLCALGAFGVLVFSVIALMLPGPFNIPTAYAHEASIIFVIAALVVQIGLPSSAIEQAYQASGRFDRTNRIQILTSTVQMVLSIVAVLTGHTIVALASVQLVAAVLRLIILIIALPSSVPNALFDLTRFRWPLIAPLLHLGKWALMHNLGTAFFDLLAWLIIGSRTSMKEAALFGIASKLPKQLWNLVDRGAVVTLPRLAQSFSESDEVQLQSTFLYTQRFVLGGILPFIVLGAFFARPLIEIWAGDQYSTAATTMQWLLVLAFAHAATYGPDLILYVCRRIKTAALLSVCAGVSSIVSGLLLVSKHGAAGLAAGMALSQLIISVTSFTYLACRLTHIQPGRMLRVVLGRMTWPLLLLGAEIVISWLIGPHLPKVWMALMGVVFGCIYLGVWGVRIAIPLYREQAVIPV